MSPSTVSETQATPPRTPIVEQVMESIGQFVRGQGLQPGDRLPTEAEFAKSLNCSRNALREAINRMTSLGLVDVRRGSGMFVGNNDTVQSCARLLSSSLAVSKKDLVEFTELRRAIEGYAARQATAKASDAEIHELKHMAQAIDQAGISRQESIRRDQKFHIRLIEIGGNPLMAGLMRALMEFMYASMDTTTAIPRDTSVSADLHSQIIEALLQRDADKAEQAMEANRQFTLSRLNERKS